MSNLYWFARNDFKGKEDQKMPVQGTKRHCGSSRSLVRLKITFTLAGGNRRASCHISISSFAVRLWTLLSMFGRVDECVDAAVVCRLMKTWMPHLHEQSVTVSDGC